MILIHGHLGKFKVTGRKKNQNCVLSIINVSYGKSLKKQLKLMTIFVCFQTSPGVTALQLPALTSPSITIVIQGNGIANNPTLESSIPLNRGEIFFASMNQEVMIDVSSESMLLFQAYAAV